METLRSAQSGDIGVRLVATRHGEFLVLLENAQTGLHALNRDMRTSDRAEADRLFNRALNIANQGLKHPAWHPPVRIVPITEEA